MRIDPDTCNDPVILAAEVRRLQAVIDAEPLTLTDAEREAVEFAVQHLQDSGWGTAALRGLLERCSQFAKRESDRSKPIAKRESDRPQPIADARLAARLAALQQLSELDEELGLPRTPNPHATPSECSVLPECTDTGGT